MPAFDRLVVSCEHASARVPAAQRALFAGAARELASHRGFDRGSLALARTLARGLGAPLVAATVSRLVVDANRSAHHAGAFSRRTRALPREEREALLRRHHAPHREAVARAVARGVARGECVLHLSVHSFTPVLAGVPRRVDVALLYDPGRAAERALCARWRELLLEEAPGLRVRRNYPYRGVADGLTTALRRRFPARLYLGVELELSQARVGRDGRPDAALAGAVLASLRRLRRPGSRARPRG